MTTETLSPFAELAIGTLAPSPTNPRKMFGDLEDLANSIREQGVMQPVLVRLWPDDYPTPEGREDRPLYEIVAGERRYRASLLAGIPTLPAMVRALNTRQVLEAQIVENLQRCDVTELEEAEGYQLMMREHGYTADELAAKVGKSRAYIYGRLKLCALCESARQAYREGRLSASHALLVARIPGAKRQVEAVERIVGNEYVGPMSYRQAADYVQRAFMLKLGEAPFPTGDPMLLMRAPACSQCPNRTGNNPELYPDVSPDVCTDPGCYADKKAAHLAKEIQSNKDAGYKVISGAAAQKLAPDGLQYLSNVGDYIRLDAKGWYGGKEQTAREAVGKQGVDVVLIEDVRSGRLVEVAERKTLQAALREAGVQVISKPGRDPREIKRERAQKDEKAVRLALFDAHHAAVKAALSTTTKPVLSGADLALVARQFWAARGSESCKRIARMYVPDAPEREAHDSPWQDDDYRRTRRVTTMISEMDAGALIAFVLDLALVSTLDVPTHVDDISTPPPLLDSVRRAGLDPDAIRLEVTAPKSSKTASTPTEAPRGGEDSAAKNPVRYTHPANSDLTWTGRGKKPQWVADWLDKGNTLAELETPTQPTKAARAGDRTGDGRTVQAAGAARKPKEKALKSGRDAAGGKGKNSAGTEASATPERDPNTIDFAEVLPEFGANQAAVGVAA